MQKFESHLNSLQAQGLTNQELIEFTLTQVKDEKLAKDLRTAFSMIAINKMNSAEANSYVTDVMNRSYSRGASWGGEVIVGVLFVVVLVAVAAIVAGQARINEDEGCYEVRDCDDYCVGSWCNERCDYECVN